LVFSALAAAQSPTAKIVNTSRSGSDEFKWAAMELLQRLMAQAQSDGLRQEISKTAAFI
jgi:hypothetical protein